MTLFFISAALLVLLCLGWMLFGLFRSDGSSTDQEAVNITLARERRQTLDTALADGSIDQATFDYERQQLEFDLAAELTLDSHRKATRGGHLTAAVLVGIFVPITAGALYLHLGNPGAIAQARNSAQTQDADIAQNAPALDELLPQMEERLAQSPDDIDGWRLLGRTYLSVGIFDKARSAFEKALALDETDAPTLTQLAESIAMTQGGDLSGEPLTYINRARELDPDNEHALWLSSIALQQSGNHPAALEGFDRLAKMAQGNTEALTTIEQMRARSLAAVSGGLPVGSGATELDTSDPGASDNEIADNTSPDNSTAADSDNVVNADASIDVTVDLSDEARQGSTGDQVVFIYATATQGPPMPLAVSRLSVAELPVTVTLDNSMAMIPTMTLSAFDSVTVGARISTTGTPTAQTGDWFSEASDVVPADTDALTLTIDQQTP